MSLLEGLFGDIPSLMPAQTVSAVFKLGHYPITKSEAQPGNYEAGTSAVA
jgi:hypothetical protein